MTGLQVAVIGTLAPFVLAAVAIYLGRQLDLVMVMLRGKR